MSNEQASAALDRSSASRNDEATRIGRVCLLPKCQVPSVESSENQVPIGANDFYVVVFIEAWTKWHVPGAKEGDITGHGRSSRSRHFLDYISKIFSRALYSRIARIYCLNFVRVTARLETTKPYKDTRTFYDLAVHDKSMEAVSDAVRCQRCKREGEGQPITRRAKRTEVAPIPFVCSSNLVPSLHPCHGTIRI